MPSTKVDRLLRVGIAALMILLVYVIYAAIHQRVVLAGDSAPDFTITADNGQTVSLPGFRGKLLVLNFWASWCGPCVQEEPSLSQFAQQFADKGVVVLGVSVDRDPQAYSNFIERHHPGFLTARETRLHEDFGTFMYPETYFIDSHGKVLKKIADPADFNDPELIRFVNSVL